MMDMNEVFASVVYKFFVKKIFYPQQTEVNSENHQVAEKFISEWLENLENVRSILVLKMIFGLTM